MDDGRRTDVLDVCRLMIKHIYWKIYLNCFREALLIVVQNSFEHLHIFIHVTACICTIQWNFLAVKFHRFVEQCSEQVGLISSGLYFCRPASLVNVAFERYVALYSMCLVVALLLLSILSFIGIRLGDGRFAWSSLNGEWWCLIFYLFYWSRKLSLRPKRFRHHRHPKSFMESIK